MPSCRDRRGAHARCQPGAVSHLVKQALLNIAAIRVVDAAACDARSVGQLAQKLGVKVIHIADAIPGGENRRSGRFVNTWSSRVCQRRLQARGARLGHHEKELAARRQASTISARSAIYLMQPGAGTRVRTWTPLAGHFHGFLITHGESILDLRLT
jgi:homospermidine synthase